MDNKNVTLTTEQLDDIYFSSRPTGPAEYYESKDKYMQLFRKLAKMLSPEEFDILTEMFSALARMLEYESLYYISLGWKKRVQAERRSRRAKR